MTFLSKYLDTSEDSYNSDILEVNNIQTTRAYAFAIPLICAMLSPLPFAAGIFDWQIDLTIIVTCFLILFHTIYNISNINSVQLFVEKVSSNFNWKRPLFLQNENIRIILIINHNEKQDKFIIYFKSNEDNYQKISSIINLLSKIETFKYNFVNIDKSLFESIK